MYINKLKYGLMLLFCLCIQNLYTQTNFNKEWVTGGGVSYVVSFQTNPLTIRHYDTFYSNYYSGGNSAISDSSGKLLFCSAGFQIYDSLSNIIPNGDSIGGGVYIQYEDGFSVYSQSSIFLPFPNQKYYFINCSATDSMLANVWQAPNPIGAPFDNLLYSKIEYTGSQYEVTQRAQRLSPGVWFSKTQMMACKHANGIDWWLLKKAHNEHRIYLYLFTEDSVFDKGSVQLPWTYCYQKDIMGMLTFSPDGGEFCFTQNNFCNEVFRCAFNRLYGTIQPIEVLKAPPVQAGSLQDSTTIGLAYSPNGQFLYLTRYYGVLQYDFQDTNPNTQWYQVCDMDTTQASFQGYSATYPGADSSIYIGNWNLQGKQMSRIDHPDVKGVGCNFCRKCLRVDSLHVGGALGTPPCQPNYDLLGWPAGIEERVKEVAEVKVYPNPARDKLFIETKLKGKRELFNQMGQLLYSTDDNQIEVSGLANGVYYLRVGFTTVKVLVE